MHLFPRTTILTIATMAIGLAFSNLAVAEHSIDIAQLSTALDDLDQWVGDGENGDRWREFLRTTELREQLAKGTAADPAAVARVLQQYQSGTAGLDKRRFVTVRNELQSWLDSLRAQFVDDLPKLAWAARGDHAPLTNESFAPVQSELRSAAQNLENFLGGNSSLAQGWKSYLKWTLLEPHLSGEVELTGKSLRDLEDVLRRFRTNKPGLELPAFVRVAEALERYREVAYWYALGRNRDTRLRYASFLQELEKHVTRNLEKPTVESARQIGKFLGVIQQLGHSPLLVQQVSAKFGQPNVWAELSSTALQQLADRPVSDTTAVRDVILEAQVRGTANSSGLLTLKTMPSDDHIAIELQLVGNIQSRTSSFKKPVRVRSLGSTDFVATKQLQISDEQFLNLCASVSACTETQTCSITKTGGNLGKRLIEKIARKKVAESKSQAEYIAARHAEQRVAAKFDRQVGDAIYKARQNYDKKFHAPLERISMFPDHLHMASTSSGIQIETTLASYKQISTNQAPPSAHDDNDFTMRVHETALNNFLPHLLSGARIQQDEETEPPRIEGEVPAWLKKAAQDPKVKEKFVTSETESDETESEPNSAPDDQQATDGQQASQPTKFKPWSFLLNKEHPVSVSFDDQKMTLRIRIVELKTLEDGEESIRKNWDFLVTYLVVQDGNRVVLRREGKIEALPTGFDPVWFGDPRWGDKLTGKQVAVRKNLEENINKRAAEGKGFPPEIPLPPINLPGPNDTKQVLQLQQLNCDEGWLTLGYRLP